MDKKLLFGFILVGGIAAYYLFTKKCSCSSKLVKEVEPANPLPSKTPLTTWAQPNSQKMPVFGKPMIIKNQF